MLMVTSLIVIYGSLLGKILIAAWNKYFPQIFPNMGNKLDTTYGAVRRTDKLPFLGTSNAGDYAIGLFMLQNEILEEEKRAVEAQLRYDKESVKLIELEEKQFQEYAGKVIDHARKGGRNLYPLEHAAKSGAGGGLGPIFPGKGGVRPSYLTSDKLGTQLPKFTRDTTEEVCYHCLKAN